MSNVSWVLACVADYCPQLVELSVAGWSRITSDQLFDLLQALPKLQRIDLSLTVYSLYVEYTTMYIVKLSYNIVG